VAGESCSACGTPRKGSFRYCLSCGYDYEPRPDVATSTRWPSRSTGASATTDEPAPGTPQDGIATTDQIACPYLGLVDDPDTHFMFATPGHRCRAERNPARISLPHQGQFCLSRDYQTCPIYTEAGKPADVSPRTPGSARPSPQAGSSRLRSFGPLVLAALLIGAAVFVIGTQAQDSPSVNETPAITSSQPADDPSQTPGAP
jgi:hypothetical protein